MRVNRNIGAAVVAAVFCFAIAPVAARAAVDTYVTDYSSGKIHRYDGVTGQYYGSFGSGFTSGPLGIVRGNDGLLYVSDYTNGRIVRFVAETGEYKGLFGAGFLSLPYGMAMGPDGLLYVANYGLGNVTRFEPSTGAYKGSFGSGFVSGPSSIRFDASGTCYVANFAGNSIMRFNGATGQYLGTFASGFVSGPWDMAIAADGFMYVSCYSSQAVFKFRPSDGMYAGLFGSGFVNQAVGIGIGTDGVLNVGSLSFGWVTRLKTDGTYSGYFGYGTVGSPYFNTSDATISGTIVLQDYIPNPSTKTVTIEVRPAGSLTPVVVRTVTPSASGAYSLSVGVSGPVDITAKASHWLRSKRANVFLTSAGAVNQNFSLINGDVDNDNVVTVFDYNALSDAFDSTVGDSNWNPEADLDGDAMVTVFDYNILSANFDLAGDD